MVKLTSTQETLLGALKDKFPDSDEYRRVDIINTALAMGAKRSAATGLVKKMNSGSTRGFYTLSANVVPMTPESDKKIVKYSSSLTAPSIKNSTYEETYIPAKDDTFVTWGHYSDVSKIIKSSMYYPVFITGHSGNGKTMMIEQACAATGREYIRVQITPETDEDDLLGGFRLVDGETIFAKGPVVRAMENGAVLMIDEIDRGSNKLMALQGVLEGKPIMIKKTGEMIVPKKGFTVFATANTKGKGSDDGRFISATIIDEAFLERFTITMEQPYPSESIEKKILLKHMELFNSVDENFASCLTKWAAAIRKTYADGGIDEIISTRRLCHIIQTNSIFGDRKKAIELCVSRFDDDTKMAFIDLYEKIDSEEVATQQSFGGGMTPDDAPF